MRMQYCVCDDALPGVHGNGPWRRVPDSRSHRRMYPCGDIASPFFGNLASGAVMAASQLNPVSWLAV